MVSREGIHKTQRNTVLGSQLFTSFNGKAKCDRFNKYIAFSCQTNTVGILIFYKYELLFLNFGSTVIVF